MKKKRESSSTSNEMDKKLCLFIINMSASAGTINKPGIHGTLMNLIKADMIRYRVYLDFMITKNWLQSL